jgi:hypothetical protein
MLIRFLTNFFLQFAIVFASFLFFNKASLAVLIDEKYAMITTTKENVVNKKFQKNSKHIKTKTKPISKSLKSGR